MKLREPDANWLQRALAGVAIVVLALVGMGAVDSLQDQDGCSSAEKGFC